MKQVICVNLGEQVVEQVGEQVVVNNCLFSAIKDISELQSLTPWHKKVRGVIAFPNSFHKKGKVNLFFSLSFKASSYPKGKCFFKQVI